MRLIDADKLKVYLQEYLHYGHAIPWVDAQPTAYDVEKVVEQMEELKAKYKKLIEVCEDKFDAYELDCKCIQISKDIEIVKRGGAE